MSHWMMLLLYVLMGLLVSHVSCISSSSSSSSVLYVSTLGNLLPNEHSYINISTGYVPSHEIIVDVTSSDSSIVVIPHPNVTLDKHHMNASVQIHANDVGTSLLHFHVKGNIADVATPSPQRVYVIHSRALSTLSSVIGWIYFVAWSISFYPQTIVNFRRRSVDGLSFDFLAYNLLGFLIYFFYNLSLYAFPYVRRSYQIRHDGESVPVHINDIVFASHAVVLTLICIAQCFVFKNTDQRVSKLTCFIIAIMLAFIGVCGAITGAKKLNVLDFVTWISYIKLAITLIKYIPQAVMNYRRKSTVGWSIGNILLDLTGGIFSIVQMMIDGYNRDEYGSIMGNFTKFGLGAISVGFDVIFILQHYVFYRESKDTPNFIKDMGGSHEKLMDDTANDYDSLESEKKTSYV